MANRELNPRSDLDVHYGSGYEATRLQQGRSRLEEARTRELLLRYLPPPPAEILDVAAGPGAYALWLTEFGYRVHLRDLLPLHVELAQQAIASQPGLAFASAEVGDARRVSLPDDRIDAVLLMGALYHLTDRTDRIAAIREAARVIRPGGLVFAVGISRFASLVDGLHEDRLDDPVFLSMMEEDIRSGQHRNPTDNPGYFTTAFFHHPDELQAEAAEVGLLVESCLAIEGPAYVVGDFDGWWSEPARRDRLLAAIRLVEREPSLLGVSPHLLVVARRPL